MALTTTSLNGTVTASATQITLAAFTNPATSGISAKTLLRFATGEYCLVTDASLTPTLQVVRGYWGTLAAAHTIYEGITYGLMSDSAWPAAAPNVTNAAIAQVSIVNAQEITATGATGTTAGVVTIPSPGYLNATGVSGTGINLPIPVAGASYWVKNLGTGVIKAYCVGGTINGTTGTTAVSITATGNLGEQFTCATAGAWQVVPIAT